MSLISINFHKKVVMCYIALVLYIYIHKIRYNLQSYFSLVPPSVTVGVWEVDTPV